MYMIVFEFQMQLGMEEEDWELHREEDRWADEGTGLGGAWEKRTGRQTIDIWGVQGTFRSINLGLELHFSVLFHFQM